MCAMRRFKKGDLVGVKAENSRVRWRKPHLRTPGYIYGLVGTVERDCSVCGSLQPCHPCVMYTPCVPRSQDEKLAHCIGILCAASGSLNGSRLNFWAGACVS